MVGGTIGYNWQALGSPWVFGLEGDIDWTNIKGTFTSVTCPTGCQTKNTWLHARGRIGYAWDRVMPYVTGGAAFKASQAGFAGVKSTKAGWTAGAGIEAALAGNWTAKVEYLHVDLGDIELRPSDLLAAHARRVPCRRSARRLELPVLIAPSTVSDAKPRTKPSGAFAHLEHRPDKYSFSVP